MKNFTLSFLIALAFLIPVSSFAQDGKFMLYSRLGSSWGAELNLGLRYMVKPGLYADLNAGYIVRLSSEIPVAGHAFENVGQEDIWKYSGYAIRPGIVFQKPESRWLQTINLLFKYGYIPHKFTENGFWAGTIEDRYRYSRETVGMGLEYLINYRILPNSSLLKLDVFTGLGFKFVRQKDHVFQENFGHYNNFFNSADYFRTQTYPFVPTLLFGLNLGLQL